MLVILALLPMAWANEDGCYSADIVDASMADNVHFRYKDESADLGGSSTQMQFSMDGGSSFRNYGAASPAEFKDGYWVSAMWNVGLNFFPQRLLINGDVVHTWDSASDAPYYSCASDSVDCAGVPNGNGVMNNGECCASGNVDDCGVCEGNNACNNEDVCYSADIVDASMADNVHFRYKDESADLGGSSAQMQFSMDGGSSFRNYGAASPAEFKDGYWVSAMWNVGLNFFPQRLLINGDVVHTWDSASDAPYNSCASDSASDSDDAAEIDSLAELEAWCDASPDNCATCRGKWVGAQCYANPAKVAKCRKFKGTEICDRIKGCHSKVTKKGKTKCMGKKHGLA